MSKNIITPAEAAGMTKYGIDVEDANPAAILYGIHKRVVGNENRMTQLADLVNSLKIELEMMAGEIAAMKSGSCECKKRKGYDFDVFPNHPNPPVASPS